MNICLNMDGRAEVFKQTKDFPGGSSLVNFSASSAKEAIKIA